MSYLNRENPIKAKLAWFPDLDHHTYESLAQDGKTVTMWLEQIRQEKTGVNSIYAGLTFGGAVRLKNELRAKGLNPPLLAVEEAWAAGGIDVYSAFGDVISKAWEFSGTDALLPEIISNGIYVGLMRDSYVEQFCIGAETVIAGQEYRRVYLTTTEANRRLREVGKTDELPEIKIQVNDTSVKLDRFGAYLTISGIDQKWMRTNVFAVALAQIGDQIRVEKFDRLLLAIKNGTVDGSDAATVIQPATTSVIEVEDILEWAEGLNSPYRINRMAGNKAVRRKYATTLITLNNFSTQFQTAGIQLPENYRWDSDNIPTDQYIGVDSRYCMEHITTGSIMVESERIIRRDMNGTAISHWYGFSKIDNSACAVWDTTF